MNRSNPFTFKEFKYLYSKVPRLCVDLVIKSNNGILLTFRKKNGYENQWHIPGGTVFYREKLIDAAKRVAKEELGVNVTIQKFIGYIEYFSEEAERGFGYTVTLVFLCKLNDLKFVLDNQTSKVGFFKIIPKNTIKEQKKFLNKFFY